MARQDPRGREEGRDAKHAYLKPKQLRWTGHVKKIPDE